MENLETYQQLITESFKTMYKASVVYRELIRTIANRITDEAISTIGSEEGGYKVVNVCSIINNVHVEDLFTDRCFSVFTASIGDVDSLLAKGCTEKEKSLLLELKQIKEEATPANTSSYKLQRLYKIMHTLESLKNSFAPIKIKETYYTYNSFKNIK